MSNFMIIFITLCYILVAYGACNVIAFGSGPFRIFEYLREGARRISPHFALLFTCMMCLPANFGWICSLVNWFLVPMPFTPFNIIFNGYNNLWPLAALCDGAFTTAIVYLIYIIDEYFEKKTEYIEKYSMTEDEIEGYDKEEF